MKMILIALSLVACGATEPANECATPSAVVTCDEQNFFTFELQSVSSDASPTWLGSQCRTKPCTHGSACEVRGVDGTFIEGICR